MRVILTGATGFIGKAVTEKLLVDGKEVCALVRPASNSKVLKSLGVQKTIEYTSLDSPDVLRELKAWQPDAMIHLAWKGVSGGQRNDALHFTKNIPFTLDCVSLAHAAGCKQWVGMGSQAEYGVPNKQVAEGEPCQPVTAYGKAKLATGIAALGLCETFNMQGAWCRIFSVYGPGDHAGTFLSYIIHSFAAGEEPSLTACEQQWDYLYITDAAAAICALLQNRCTGVYNIGSDETVVLKDVVEKIKGLMETDLRIGYGEKPYVPQQVMHLQAGVSKLKKDTGWQPVVALETGLQNTILSIQKPVGYENV